MEKNVSTDLHSPEFSRENGVSARPIVETKMRLFGFDLNPSMNDQSCLKLGFVEEGEEKSSNSTPTTILKEKAFLSTLMESDHEKKLVCQYCFKEFANSQALGGHQNAHRKERMKKKKKLQFQAKKDSLSHYFQPGLIQYNHGLIYHNPTWFYHRSIYTPDDHQSTVHKDQTSQISFFSSYGKDQSIDLNGSHEFPRSVALAADHSPFEEEKFTFTLTHSDKFRESRPVNVFELYPLPSSR